ncbi:MAG: hypothetical protein AVDCRST_MAG49-3075, partial [uncultured Thermomicrobiales bacterium]
VLSSGGVRRTGPGAEHRADQKVHASFADGALRRAGGHSGLRGDPGDRVAADRHGLRGRHRHLWDPRGGGSRDPGVAGLDRTDRRGGGQPASLRGRV